MFSQRQSRGIALLAGAVGATIALVGCAQADPLATEGSTDPAGESETIIVGSQAYYSNEIIAEIYAQALENAGFDVERNFSIGQREAYLPAIEAGEVDLFPEYTGNLLQYYSPDTTATAADDVYAELADALPEGLQVLAQSPATDQNSYNVTAEYAEENDLESIADLASIEGGIILGGNPELEERPYGPAGLESFYGVTATVQPTGDTTVESLIEGIVNVGNVYSADPRIEQFDLVTLDDPEGMFLASNVVPLAASDLSPEVIEIIDELSAALTPEGLISLNVRSTIDEESASVIATSWLEENGFLS